MEYKLMYSDFFHRSFNRLTKIIFSRFMSHFFISKNDFAGKKILIIGPASTVNEELKGIDLTDFDLIVRMNKAIDLPVITKNSATWRIDVLFHNLKENGVRPAGRITKSKVARSSIKQIVFPEGGFHKFDVVLYHFFKFKLKGIEAKLLVFSPDFYLDIKKSLNGYSPTTGFAALKFLLDCDFDSLSIVGFTFFKTKYTAGYNDNLEHDFEAANWAKKGNIHAPELEALAFKEDTKAKLAVQKKIILGKYVTQALMSF